MPGNRAFAVHILVNQRHDLYQDLSAGGLGCVDFVFEMLVHQLQGRYLQVVMALDQAGIHVGASFLLNCSNTAAVGKTVAASGHMGNW